MIRMAVFDMAGTTVDEDNTVYKTLQKAINEAGFRISLDEVLAEGAGKEKLQAIKSILEVYAKNDDALLAENIYHQFMGYLSTAYEKFPVREQPNTLEVFHALKERDIIVVLNTGYNQATAALLIDQLQWKEDIDYDTVITASDVANNRPQPDMIQLAMQRFGITNGEEVIKIGDSTIDIEEGRNASCALLIGITTGAHTKEQLWTAKPDFVIDNLLELLPILDKH